MLDIDQTLKTEKPLRSYAITFGHFKNSAGKTFKALIHVMSHDGNVIQKSFDGESFEEIMDKTKDYWKSL